MIPEDFLVIVIKEDVTGPFFCYAFLMVLSHEFLRNEKRYHVSTDITSHILVSLLNLRSNQVDILMVFLEDNVKIILLAK